MPEKGRLRGIFDDLHAQRQGILDRARQCAALTKPWILPPENHDPQCRLPENNQSIGSYGLGNLTSKMLLALFPPDTLWFRRDPSPEVFDGSVPNDQIELAKNLLFIQDVYLAALLESPPTSYGRMIEGFRTSKRKSIEQLLCTGSTLEYLDDQYRLKVFRRDQYVTKRDQSGCVLCHAICETIDAAQLDEKVRRDAGIEYDDELTPYSHKRQQNLYTFVEWQPSTKKWTIYQEVNGYQFNEVDEQFTPYFSSEYELAPGEDYGRGKVEIHLGDMLTYDTLNLRLNQFAELASKHLLALDRNSDLRPDDFAQPTGSFVRADVRDGKVLDAAFFKPEQIADFSIVQKRAEMLAGSLAEAWLIQTRAVRDSERTTAYEVARVTVAELEGALGSVYAAVADEQQVPLVERLMYQAARDKLIRPVDRKNFKIRTLTGISALAQQAKLSDIKSLVEDLAALGPEAIGRVNIGVLVNMLARMRSFHEPGLILSDEEYAAKVQAAINTQLQATAGEQAIKSAGTIAENVLATR